MQAWTRRQFLGCCVLAASAFPVRNAFGMPRALRRADPHPTPRAGITGSRVATHEQLAARPKLVDLFDSVREVPQIIDGIRCNCGCSHNEGFYSLLSCYEGKDAMAKDCPICQGQGRLAVRLHKAGRSLDEIRSAIDAKFA